MRRLLAYATRYGLPSIALVLCLIGCSHSPLHSRVHTLRWESGWRTYRIHVPPNLPHDKPVPLMVVLHGVFINAAMMEAMSGFSDLADEKGFIVVYPNARKSRLRSFYAGLPMKHAEAVLGAGFRADEIGFINAVVDDVAMKWPIDPNRTFLGGLSNGGLLTTHIASADLGQRFRGYALVAMSSPSAHIEALNAAVAERGQLAHRMPIIIIHGTDDPLFPYEGGRVFGLPDSWSVSGAEATAGAWDKINGGDGLPDAATELPDTARWDKTRTRVHAYRDRDGRISVLLYEIEDAGHSWPGPKMLFSPAEKLLGGKCSDFEASRAIWGFFTRD